MVSFVVDDHDSLVWPPPYKVRRSTRAKTIHLKISPHNGLEIIIPAYRKRFNIEQILWERKAWIEKWTERMIFISPAGPVLPDNVVLKAVSKVLPVSYRFHLATRFNIKEVGGTLYVTGNIQNIDQCLVALRKWLKKQAEHYLVPWISTLSTQSQLIYSAVAIRCQSTVWGSCTAAKKIHLNYGLLFLPPNVVEYVLWHELCHLRHLNHSTLFWSLVKQWDPQYEAHRAELKNLETIVPIWARRLAQRGGESKVAVKEHPQ